MAKELIVGKVAHYYTRIGVAIIDLTGNLNLGEEIVIRGATTSVRQKVDSMEIDHKPVASASPGQSIGLKVAQRVREGDTVFRIHENTLSEQ